MRIDKFLVSAGICTRTEASLAAKRGLIVIDGRVVKDVSDHIDPQKCRVMFDGELIEYREFTYIMLNKPEGYISSTDDPSSETVLSLLPERLRKINLFPAGRLDIDTTGLLILTNNGNLAHKLLSPKHHVDKTYLFRAYKSLSEKDINALENGVKIEGGYVTQSAKIEMTGLDIGKITIHEGKYHQIKQMFESVANKIIYLERIVFADITLDEKLARGDWRYLNENEQKILENHM